jgi:hypothetical protein
MTGKRKLQGEGDYEAARSYRKDVENFAEKRDVKGAAQAARKAVEGSEGAVLRDAEKAGKARAKGFDPKVKKN